MKLLILFFSTFYFTTCLGQTGFLSAKNNVDILYVYAGESNSGGYGTNDSLSVGELSSRSSLKIFNNWTSVFENLHIGYNNLVLHQAIVTNGSHGLEAGFANEFDSNKLGTKPMYLLKGGQGGTEIQHWESGVLYQGKNCWDTLTKRMDTAIKYMRSINQGQKPSIVLIWTQGINDTQVPTDATAWKDSTKAFFIKFRLRYGFNIPILMLKLPNAFTTYNAKIDDLVTEVPNFTAISTTTAPLLNANHWNMTGFKIIAYTIIQTLLTSFQHLL